MQNTSPTFQERINYALHHINKNAISSLAIGYLGCTVVNLSKIANLNPLAASAAVCGNEITYFTLVSVLMPLNRNKNEQSNKYESLIHIAIRIVSLVSMASIYVAVSTFTFKATLAVNIGFVVTAYAAFILRRLKDIKAELDNEKINKTNLALCFVPNPVRNFIPGVAR